MAFGVIYLLIDGTNDIEYVGQTTKSVKKRFKQHSNNKDSYIGRTIHAHGVDMFVIAILKECDSKEELDFWERHFIKSRDTKFPNGYNMTNGGEGGLERTPESIAKISVANSGENNPQFGKPLSDEHKAKVSAGQPNKHAIICIEDKEIYDSVTAAARYFGVNRSSIINACKNHQCTVAGKHLWYLEDFNNATEIIIPPPKTKPQKRAIICLENGMVFETIRQAAKWLGVVHGAISRACRKHHAANGYHFRYLDDVPEAERTVTVAPQTAHAKKLSLKSTNPRSVKCIETGQIFHSLSEAARYCNIRSSNIHRACQKDTYTAGKMHWQYLDEQQSPQA